MSLTERINDRHAHTRECRLHGCTLRRKAPNPAQPDHVNYRRAHWLDRAAKDLTGAVKS